MWKKQTSNSIFFFSHKQAHCVCKVQGRAADHLFVSSGGTILFYMLFYTALHSKWFGGGFLCLYFYSLRDLKIRDRTLLFKWSTSVWHRDLFTPQFNLFTKYDPEGLQFLVTLKALQRLAYIDWPHASLWNNVFDSLCNIRHTDGNYRVTIALP